MVLRCMECFCEINHTTEAKKVDASVLCAWIVGSLWIGFIVGNQEQGWWCDWPVIVLSWDVFRSLIREPLFMIGLGWCVWNRLGQYWSLGRSFYKDLKKDIRAKVRVMGVRDLEAMMMLVQRIGNRNWMLGPHMGGMTKGARVSIFTKPVLSRRWEGRKEA